MSTCIDRWHWPIFVQAWMSPGWTVPSQHLGYYPGSHQQGEHQLHYAGRGSSCSHIVSDEFAVTMDGVNTVSPLVSPHLNASLMSAKILVLMKQLSYDCALRAFFLVPSRDTDVCEPVSSASYTKAQLVEIIQSSLKDLQSLCSSRKDLVRCTLQHARHWLQLSQSCIQDTFWSSIQSSYHNGRRSEIVL